jgi:hypothetical protein
VLDLQLEVLEQLEVGAAIAARPPALEAIEQQRSQRIVTATAIADGDDEEPGARDDLPAHRAAFALRARAFALGQAGGFAEPPSRCALRHSPSGRGGGLMAPALRERKHRRRCGAACRRACAVDEVDSRILPRACVAHDRQGSNARMATSM